jgi:hypothetical protein
MKTLDVVKLKASEYDESRAAFQSELSERFKSLVKNHGVTFVAAATGLRESSVSQYQRCKIVPISEAQVLKAEEILNNL